MTEVKGPMRISELSRRGGVPLPTVKYYLREGLLPPGDRTAPNQADYTDDHLHRLRLIRVLSEVGGLGLGTVREVIDAIDDTRRPLHRLLGVAQYALGCRTDEPDSSELEGALADVDSYLRSLGWRVSRTAPARRDLAATLVALRRLGRDATPEVFDRYARVADRLAAEEVAAVGDDLSRAERVERIVIGTVVFETALAALRRLAHEHHSARTFGRRGS